MTEVTEIPQTEIQESISPLDQSRILSVEEQKGSAKAAELAAGKAKSIAESLNVRLGDISSISESSYDYVPYTYYGDAMMAKAEAAPTPILPQEVTVRATVTVSYEME